MARVKLTRCREAASYQATRAPRCGCVTCETRWQAKLRAQAARRRRMLGTEAPAAERAQPSQGAPLAPRKE